MNYLDLSKSELLNEIEKKLKSIIKLGRQLEEITPDLEMFDFYLIAALNRTINISKAYVQLIYDNNFLAAAPLVRINLDTLLRIYASLISEFDRNTFAHKAMSGNIIGKMKLNGTNEFLTDKTLYTELSKIDGMYWVSDIYKAGSSFVHFEKSHIFSSLNISDKENRIVKMTIGFHDSFIPETEKKGSAVWMNKIIDAIVVQTQLWFFEKAEKVGFDIEKLNE
jgi:hypothetical protein